VLPPMRRMTSCSFIFQKKRNYHELPSRGSLPPDSEDCSDIMDGNYSLQKAIHFSTAYQLTQAI